MSGIIPPDGVYRDDFTVPTSRATVAQNKIKTRTSCARGVMQSRRKFGLFLLQRQLGEVVSILHKPEHQLSLNVCPKIEACVEVTSLEISSGVNTGYRV